MYISKIRVQNYKAFHDSGWIEFKPGINIISGQNHSGKTALLEALELNFKNIPHKSLITLPDIYAQTKRNSEIQICITVTAKEVVDFITNNNFELILPRHQQKQFSSSQQAGEFISEALENKLEKNSSFELIVPVKSEFFQSRCSFDEKKLFLLLQKTEFLNNLTFDIYEDNRTTFDTKTTLETSAVGLRFFYENEPLVKFNFHSELTTQYAKISTVRILIDSFHNIRNKTYRFYAERKNIGKYEVGDSLNLEPDASNLAEVVHCLQSRFHKTFDLFNNLVSVVLPHITRISTRLIVNEEKKEVALRIWSIDPETDRDDLAFPLEACSTGVGKVLAILYVVTTSKEPRTIIIDEPQSFLHPGAAKKLIEILQDFPQHQYFISTHSPSIISAANPSSITMLKYQDSEATPISISADDSEEMRSLLDEVGVHLSDVFGSDNILWVEGPTEERCFPMILKKVAQIPLRGTQILAVKNTGDLEGKRSEIIFDIYDRLSGGKALLPPAVGFIFDKENKSDQTIADLKKRSKGKLNFLERCMYENYLLDTEAITIIANKYDFKDEFVEVLEIDEWITSKKQEWIDKQVKEGTRIEDLTDDYWLAKVHAAKLLENLFRHFSNGKVVYRKTTHSIELTKWLVENKPEQLQDIANLLKDVLKRTKSDCD